MSAQRADQSDLEFTGPGLGRVQNLLKGFVGACPEHGHALGVVDHLGDEFEAVGIELGVLRQSLQHEMGHVQTADGIAVRRAAGEFRGAQNAPCAGLVDEYPRLFHIFIPVFLHDPGLYVAGAAGGEDDDHVQGFFGIGGGSRKRGHQGQHQSHEKKSRCFCHLHLSLLVLR